MSDNDNIEDVSQNKSIKKEYFKYGILIVLTGSFFLVELVFGIIVR